MAVKITKIEEQKKTFEGKSSVSYVIHTSDGKKGYLEKDCFGKFREGDDVVVEVTKTGTGKSGPWEQWKLSFALAASSVVQQATTQYPASKPEPLAQPTPTANTSVLKEKSAYVTALMETVLNAFFEGKVDNQAAFAKFKEWKEIGFAAIDEIASNK